MEEKFLFKKDGTYNYDDPNFSKYEKKVKEVIFPVIEGMFNDGYRESDIMHFLNLQINWLTVEKRLSEKVEKYMSEGGNEKIYISGRSN